MKRDPELETEGLLLGIKLAEQKAARKTFRGNSKEKSVRVRIEGDHSPNLVEIDGEAFDIPKEAASQIAAAVQEAFSRAIENAQRSSLRMLDEELGQKKD